MSFVHAHATAPSISFVPIGLALTITGKQNDTSLSTNDASPSRLHFLFAYISLHLIRSCSFLLWTGNSRVMMVFLPSRPQSYSSLPFSPHLTAPPPTTKTTPNNDANARTPRKMPARDAPHPTRSLPCPLLHRHPLLHRPRHALAQVPDRSRNPTSPSTLRRDGLLQGHDA